MADITAKIAPVTTRLLSIDGLIDKEGRHYVGVPQIADELYLGKKQPSRLIKALMGEDFLFTKLKTPLNNKAINAIPVAFVDELIGKLAVQGNPRAREIVLGKTVNPSNPKVLKKYLYVIWDEPRGVCKIGIASNVERRLRSIQTCYPFRLSVFFAKLVTNPRAKEISLHKSLKNFRLNGEWFDSNCLQIVDWSSL